ncbi:MAG: NAD-dependent epimerase/dehydratase family protein, partial [Pseudonocardiaceae bacterium]
MKGLEFRRPIEGYFRICRLKGRRRSRLQSTKSGIHVQGRAIGVVGAAGFIGRNLTERLRYENRSVMQYTRAKPCISRDGTLESAVKSCSSIVWLASSINPLLAEEHPRLIVENATALRETLGGLHNLPYPPRFIYLSSGGTVYGESSPPPFSETDKPQPQTAYGRAKLAEELIVKD